MSSYTSTGVPNGQKRAGQSNGDPTRPRKKRARDNHKGPGQKQRPKPAEGKAIQRGEAPWSANGIRWTGVRQARESQQAHVPENDDAAPQAPQVDPGHRAPLRQVTPPAVSEVYMPKDECRAFFEACQSTPAWTGSYYIQPTSEQDSPPSLLSNGAAPSGVQDGDGTGCGPISLQTPTGKDNDEVSELNVRGTISREEATAGPDTPATTDVPAAAAAAAARAVTSKTAELDTTGGTELGAVTSKTAELDTTDGTELGAVTPCTVPCT